MSGLVDCWAVPVVDEDSHGLRRSDLIEVVCMSLARSL